MIFDTLIEHGMVVDGSGAPWFRAAVGIRHGVVTLLRGDTTSCQSLRRIDASGRIVCPGFVDTHAHSDLALYSHPTCESKVRQGVGSEINGNCGIGFAPMGQSAKQSMSHYFSGVMGRTAETSTWTSVGQYLDAVDGKVGINQGYMVPHGGLRLETVGWEGRSATAAEIRRMADMLRHGMEDGALGLSSGLTYPPGMWAETSELIELCAVVREMGGIYATHVRYTLGDGVTDGFREAIAISRASQVPLHISHFYVPAVLRGDPNTMLAIIDDARAQGVDVTFDAYTYEYGSSTLASVLPAWAHTEGPEGLLRHLCDESFRQRLRDEGPPKWPANRMLVASTVAPQDKECEGRMLSDIAEVRGQDVWDAIVDLLVRSDLEVSFTVETGDCNDIAAFVTHDAFMVGSDSILVDGHSNPRTYGTFPRLLETYVRQRGCLSLENAIRKMTWLPAQRFGLAERGLLRDNARADIVVFDPLTVGSSSTLSEPNVCPVGIDYVFVNGVAVLESGKLTGVTPGTVLKRKPAESCA